MKRNSDTKSLRSVASISCSRTRILRHVRRSTSTQFGLIL